MAAEVRTMDALEPKACTLGGVQHDYRRHDYLAHNAQHTSWRCVWCHVVACGAYGDPHGCMEPYHHRTPHRSADGTTWAIGTARVQP